MGWRSIDGVLAEDELRETELEAQRFLRGDDEMSKETFPCMKSGCDRSFDTPHGLEVHVARAHKGERPEKAVQPPKATPERGGDRPPPTSNGRVTVRLSLDDLEELRAVLQQATPASLDLADATQLRRESRRLGLLAALTEARG
jgi:hypothetical protein